MNVEVMTYLQPILMLGIGFLIGRYSMPAFAKIKRAISSRFGIWY